MLNSAVYKPPSFVSVRYHLKDVIVGKIYFLLVRIKIQHMELQLIKKEITGIGKMNFETVINIFTFNLMCSRTIFSDISNL